MLELLLLRAVGIKVMLGQELCTDQYQPIDKLRNNLFNSELKGVVKHRKTSENAFHAN